MESMYPKPLQAVATTTTTTTTTNENQTKENKKKKSKHRSSRAQTERRTRRKSITDEIESLKNLDINSVRKSALAQAFPNPFELTPRTQYTINLLGFSAREYNHFTTPYSKTDHSKHLSLKNINNNNNNNKNDDDNQASSSSSPPTDSSNDKVDPISKLKEYNYWDNMSKTLNKIHDKRAELIESQMTFDDIEQKENQIEETMIENMVEINKEQTLQAHNVRNRQVEAFIKERKQQLLDRIEFNEKQEKLHQQQVKFEKAEKEHEQLLHEQQERERKQQQRLLKNRLNQRWNDLKESAEWHIEQDKEKDKERRLSITSHYYRKKMIEGNDEKYYKRYLKQKEKEYKLCQLKRTQLLTKYENKDNNHRKLLRNKSEYYINKNKNRANLYQTRLENIKTQRLNKIEKWENKFKNDNKRVETIKKQQFSETLKLKNENDFKRKEIYNMAKTRQQDALKTFVKNLNESEIRRLKYQEKERKKRIIQREMYNIAKDNAKKELKHINKSKETKSNIMNFQFNAMNQRSQKENMLKQLFIHQRSKRDDLQSKLDAIYKKKIDDALQYDDITNMKMLLNEYQIKNKQLQDNELNMIEKDILKTQIEN